MTPTFAMLRDKQRLRVRNPENDVQFTISLRNSCGLFAVRIYPDKQCRGNPYTTAHRIMSRNRIEDWLSELQTA